MSERAAVLTPEKARIEIDTYAASWRTIVDASNGDLDATGRLAGLHHPLLVSAWQLGTAKARNDACWNALRHAREVGNPEATDILAAFFAHDPVRTFEKLNAFRPVAVMVAEGGELTSLRPKRSGVPIGGRLIWFVTEDGGMGQVSWPKVATRAQPSDSEVLARVARLIVHPRIRSFRESSGTASCGLCGETITGVSHVDHIIPFSQLLDEWLATVPGGESTVVGATTNPSDSDPYLADARLEASWSAWHAERAGLRLTHDHCNLARPR